MKILYVGSTSACLEIENQSPYYAPETYTVYLDGEQCRTGNTNVFSLFSLKPDREYSVDICFSSGQKENAVLKTAKETCCINVKDFGAVGDGVQEDTDAIQTAIRMMPEGGRLFFPEGTYLTLPLALKSHITLELAENAVISGSTDRSRYPVIPGFVKDMETGKEIPFGGFEGNEVAAYQSLLHASYAEDITVVGKGTIDGNGQNGDWWGDFKSFPAARPRVFFCNRSKNVTFHGVTIANGPSWHMHPFFSRNISFLDCLVSAPKQSPNTDAIDPESCDGVNIIGCRFSVGDDCIAVKSGKIEMGVKYKTPATGEGNFWHKAIYPDQVWLDGIYMAQPFYAMYEKYFGSGDYSDTVKQIKTVRARMFDEQRGLYFHGYDASKSIFWADPETGCSQNFWLRSIGWFSVALADLLEVLPEGGQKEDLAEIFRELMASLDHYADDATGIYWQVVDQGGREGNYLETSGSSMIAYAMLKGVRLGILDKAYAAKGQKTFHGIAEKYLSFTGDTLNLGGICLVAGLGPENNLRRDGSYEYYISEPVVENDAKGVAPFILAYTEIMRL